MILFLFDVKKLLAEGYNIPAGSMVLLLDLYLNYDKLVEAKEIFQQLKANNSEFVLDKYKVIKMTETIARTDSVESESILNCCNSIIYYLQVLIHILCFKIKYNQFIGVANLLKIFNLAFYWFFKALHKI